jgi:acyl carrier protein
VTTLKENAAMSTSPDSVRSRLVRIVLSSAEGDLTERDLAAANWSLPEVRYSSLAYIRMIDTVENELGVYLDPEEESDRFETIDSLVELICQHLQESADA